MKSSFSLPSCVDLLALCLRVAQVAGFTFARSAWAPRAHAGRIRSTQFIHGEGRSVQYVEPHQLND